MRIEVTTTEVRRGPLEKYHLTYPHNPECSGYAWFPVSLSPELLTDVLNDALLEEIPTCEVS